VTATHCGDECEREVGGFASPPILAVVKKKKKDGFLKCLVSFETKNEMEFVMEKY
jgi:hypothetical protein